MRNTRFVVLHAKKSELFSVCKTNKIYLVLSTIFTKEKRTFAP